MTSLDRVIIAGMPRSGTTLLASFLAAQPAVRFITDYIPTFHHAAEQLGVGFSEHLDRQRRRVALMMVRDRFIRMGHAVLVQTEEFASLDELHAQVMAELAGEGQTVAGHKAVLESRQVHHLLDRTDIHCVVMLRDPRDAALSFWYRTGGGVEEYVDRWNEMSRFLRRSSNPRLHEIRFETLLEQPQLALAPLERSLGLRFAWDLAGLHFEQASPRRRSKWPKNSAFDDVQHTFDTGATGRWRSRTASPIVRYAGWASRHELASQGYEAPTRLGLRETARFHLTRLAARSERRLRDGTEWASRHVLQRLAQPLEP